MIVTIVIVVIMASSNTNPNSHGNHPHPGPIPPPIPPHVAVKNPYKVLTSETEIDGISGVLIYDDELAKL